MTAPIILAEAHRGPAMEKIAARADDANFQWFQGRQLLLIVTDVLGPLEGYAPKPILLYVKGLSVMAFSRALCVVSGYD